MAQLADSICRLIEEGRYVVSEHASERIVERGFLEWQVVVGTTSGRVLRERPKDLPNPAVEFEAELPDGSPFKAVWSLLTRMKIAKLVTVHYFDEA